MRQLQSTSGTTGERIYQCITILFLKKNTLKYLPSVWATVIRVLMVSMFLDFISVMGELAVSSVNLASAWTYASLSS